MSMRLNKYLAACGLGSRRSCESIIMEGRVVVNGEVCRELATKIGPDDSVFVDAESVEPKMEATLMLHKPAGFICSRSDPHNAQNIYELIPERFHHLAHVGRLDRESEGLIILSNRGDLTEKLLHPRNHVEKEYLVSLNRPFDEKQALELVKGVRIESGIAIAKSVEIISPRRLSIVLEQGMKRQLRYMMAALGYEVRRLVRTRIGKWTIDRLAPGRWRLLSTEDQDLLTQNLPNFQNSHSRGGRKGGKPPSKS